MVCLDEVEGRLGQWETDFFADGLKSSQISPRRF